MKVLRLLLVLALAMAGAGCTLPTMRGPSTGLPGPCAIRGRIIDREALARGQHVVIPDAVLTLQGSALSGERVARSDVSGAFHFPAIPPGRNYRVIVKAGGYATIVVYVTLEGSQTVFVTVGLDSGMGCRFEGPPPCMLDYTQAN